MSVGRRKFLELGALGLGMSWSGVGCGSRCVPKAGFFTTESCVNEIQVEDVEKEPKSLTELHDLVVSAEALRRTIRMAGSRHSYSDAAFSRDTILRPTGLTRVLDIPRDQLRRSVDASKLVRVEAGATIRQLNQCLLERQLAFENLGGFDAQTIVGAAITGTHGSGRMYGPIASQIVSIQVVASCGRVLQVEPTCGITDAEIFPGFIVDGEAKIPVELIQDDAVFGALSVSAGMMGIVYAVVLRAAPLYYLLETRTMWPWELLVRTDTVVSRAIRGTPRPNDPEHVEVYLNPYRNENGVHDVLVTTRSRRPSPRDNSDNARQRNGNFFGQLQRAYAQNGAVDLAKLLYGARNIQGLLGYGLGNLADKVYEDVSFKVFNLGTPNYFEAYAVEMGFPIEKTVEAVELLFSEAEARRKRGQNHLSPPALRFTRRIDAHLSMADGRDTATIEIGMLGGGKEHPEILAYGKKFLLEYQELFLSKGLGARPHLGLDLEVVKGTAAAEKIFPRFGAWRALYEEFNSTGVFNNPMTDRLGISVTSGSSCPRPSLPACPAASLPGCGCP